VSDLGTPVAQRPQALFPGDVVEHPDDGQPPFFQVGGERPEEGVQTLGHQADEGERRGHPPKVAVGSTVPP
jgi:hypothetical protein